MWVEDSSSISFGEPEASHFKLILSDAGHFIIYFHIEY